MRNEIVITGRGLVTPLGTGLEKNEIALRKGQSGIVFVPEWQKLGLESQVAGLTEEKIETCPLIDKKSIRYMTSHAVFGTIALHEALTEAGLQVEDLKNKRVAIVLGHGGSTQQTIYEGGKILIDTGKSKKLSPFTVPRVMPSSAVASISLILGISGESYAICSACASGAHAVMIATRLLQAGLYDLVITGGTEEVNWVQALGFDAMRALSRNYNSTPKRASRPFDKDRDGFVVAAGAGIMVLESAEHAKSRGARAIVKISGFAANSNGTDMVVPDADAGAKVMEAAIKDANLKPADVGYINTHGTATPIGDPIEMAAIKKVFYETNKNIPINSTKSMTGHMIGATGAAEIIFCTQMIAHNFICPTINLENPEPEFAWANLVRTTIDGVKVEHALSNSFGFGGTNCCIIVSAV